MYPAVSYFRTIGHSSSSIKMPILDTSSLPFSGANSCYGWWWGGGGRLSPGDFTRWNSLPSHLLLSRIWPPALQYQKLNLTIPWKGSSLNKFTRLICQIRVPIHPLNIVISSLSFFSWLIKWFTIRNSFHGPEYLSPFAITPTNLSALGTLWSKRPVCWLKLTFIRDSF